MNETFAKLSFFLWIQFLLNIKIRKREKIKSKFKSIKNCENGKLEAEKLLWFKCERADGRERL